MALAFMMRFGHKVRMRLKYLALVSLTALAACSTTAPPQPPVETHEPTPPFDPAPMPPPFQQPKGDWTDWPLSAGDWVYRQDDRGSIALFGQPGADALVTLRCDKGRQRIYFSRAGSGGNSITIRSSSTMKQFAAGATGGTPPYIAAEIMPRDAILDAMIYSRGRVAIEAAGTQSIAVPSWTEIARVVEDCRG